MAKWSGERVFHQQYEQEMGMIMDAYEKVREASPKDPWGNPACGIAWFAKQMGVSENSVRKHYRKGEKPSARFLSRAQTIFGLDLGRPLDLPIAYGRQPEIRPLGREPAECPDCKMTKSVTFRWNRHHWLASCTNDECVYYAKFPYGVPLHELSEEMLRELLVVFRKRVKMYAGY